MTRMPMAFVTMWTNALVRWMNAGFAMARVLYLCAVVMQSQKEIATALATNSTPWGSVVAIAPRTRMPMAFATMWTNALAHQITVAFATALDRSTSAAAPTSL